MPFVRSPPGAGGLARSTVRESAASAVERKMSQAYFKLSQANV